MLQNISISDKCCSDFSIQQFIKFYGCFRHNNNTTCFWAANQNMISERLCDTEDWSNDAENSALITVINYILKYIQIENSDFKYKTYFTNVLFLLYSGPNKYGLGEQTRLLQKHITTRTVQKPSCTCFRSDTFREQSAHAAQSAELMLRSVRVSDTFQRCTAAARESFWEV